MEKIIINGVDTYGCAYLKIGADGKCYCEEDLYDDGFPVFECEECPECYYKENKRLKQENEQLKKKIESYVCSQNCYAYKQANNYRQILQEIKTIVGNEYYAVEPDARYIADRILTKINEVVGAE